MSAVSESKRSSVALAGSLAGSRLAAWLSDRRLGLSVTYAAAVVSVIAVIAYLALAVNWYSRPFIGVFLTQSLVVNSNQSLRADEWAGWDAGLQRLDRIIGMDDLRFPDSTGNTTRRDLFAAALAQYQPGDRVELHVVRPGAAAANCNDADVCTFIVQLTRFPLVDLIAWFVIPYVSAVVALAAALLTLLLRRQQPNARLTSAICALLAMVMAGLFDLNTTHRLVPLWLLAVSLAGGTLAMLSLRFPSKFAFLYRFPLFEYFPLLVGFIFGLVLIVVNGVALPAAYAPRLNSMAVLGGLFGLLMLFVSVLHCRRHATARLIRDQANVVLIGIGLAALPTVLWLVNHAVTTYTTLPSLAYNVHVTMPFLALVPLSLTYAVFQRRWFDTDWLMSQTITYGIMLFTLVAGYFLLVYGATLIVRETLQITEPLIMALTIFVIAVLFLPVRTRLQRQVDEVYFRRRANHQRQLEQFSDQLTQLDQFDAIMDAMRVQLDATLKPRQIFVFAPRSHTDEFVEMGDPPRTDVRFDTDSPLVRYLEQGDGFIYLEPGKPWPPDLVVERARVKILDALMLVGVQSRASLTALVCISGPRSGRGVYPYEDMRFVQNVVRQVSMAAGRAQVVRSLERRVRELDVLSKVSQAANFTVSFDDLLELINAQVGNLLDLSHLYIVLYEPVTDELTYAFVLENDERYRDRENQRWRAGNDLYSEVIRSGSGLNLTDYVATMRERGYNLRSEDPRLKAWMGRPLITGTSTLGMIAVGMTRPGAIFSDDQQRIFTDVSTLAATSLDKARLFEETNSRARQLAALNDISQQLVESESNLEQLLQLITASAVDILEAEAGSLLLTADDTSGDLEFKVAIGDSGHELVGSRLPSDRGLVGMVATTGEMVIVNDAMNDPRWGGELSKGNFRTNSVLAVPLTAQGRVIGVLELLNKKERALFTHEDGGLLTTFAGQAAIAIENARLFQLTDYQLSERVAELETLERMDIELNRSLDLDKVAEITVRYAMQQSEADAGVLGMLLGDSQQLQIVASHGYDAEHDYPEGSPDGFWSVEQGIVSRVLRTRLPDLTPDVTMDPDYVPSLRGALSQLTVPIMTGREINAILVLESRRRSGLTLAHMAFVQRVAEHASIAIANALLLAELNQANQSKSEFVSFVAHELKNPLTSIRGYADFLLNPQLGPLSEQQANFLGTIRANAQRMDTLVSDLNDVTKLQTNNLRISLSPISLRKVVTETLRPLQKQVEDREQTLVIDVAEDLPEIYADENRLIQVLTNLVSNAHKYTPAQGTITISAGVVAKNTGKASAPTSEMMQIMVRDTGIGMSETDLMRLFTPYFRSENPLAREQPGTGLGLTITRGIIERHGGEIWVESEINVGTAFYFTVPVATEAQTVDAEEQRGD